MKLRCFTGVAGALLVLFAVAAASRADVALWVRVVKEAGITAD
jgi:hypothetical protein